MSRDRDIGDLIASRVEFCIEEWRREADEIDGPDDEGEEPIDMSEDEQERAITLRHCADMLAEGLRRARDLA